MSSITPCEPRFPARRCLVDASALVRFFKCGALELLTRTARIVIADQVAREFKKRPGQRTALAELGVEVLPIRVGSTAYQHFSRLRGSLARTRDLGEDETLALALDACDRQEPTPVVLYDHRAARDARERGLLVMDFLDTLAWLVGCGLATSQEADAIAMMAARLDGWVPPIGYSGSIESVRSTRQDQLIASFGALAP